MFDLPDKQGNVNEGKWFKPSVLGEDVLAEGGFLIYLLEIKNLVSCPFDIFTEFYLSTIHSLANHCQNKPFPENEFSKPYGLLERQLKLAIATLKLRRGMLLPKNAGAEAISAEEAQWTYALFSSSLLRDIQILQDDLKIVEHVIDGKGADVFMAAITERIVPTQAVRWLAKNPALLKVWWSAILGEENEISHIITSSAIKAGIPLLKKAISEPHVTDGAEQFIEWITQNFKLNPGKVFRIKKGLFISENCLDDFLAQHILLSKSVFLQDLDKKNWLISNDDGFYHLVVPARFEDRSVMRGVILNEDFLPSSLQKIPLTSKFIENISF